jgi:hypothetical protein
MTQKSTPKSSEKDPENPKFISKELCDAYRQLMTEKVDSIKRAIYISATAIGVVVTIVNLIIALTKL